VTVIKANTTVNLPDIITGLDAEHWEEVTTALKDLVISGVLKDELNDKLWEAQRFIDEVMQWWEWAEADFNNNVEG